jgi:hypothetical protein
VNIHGLRTSCLGGKIYIRNGAGPSHLCAGVPEEILAWKATKLHMEDALCARPRTNPTEVMVEPELPRVRYCIPFLFPKFDWCEIDSDSEKPMMDLEEIRKFCLAFPDATENLQWGDDLCFKIGGKIFATLALTAVPQKLCFKCTPETLPN